jgi:hypothetical protein
MRLASLMRGALSAISHQLSAKTRNRRAVRWAETFRRSQDLDHWASFHDSFIAMVSLIGDVASGKKGDPPSTVLILYGDVHHGYLAEATLDNGTESHVYQAVCSPSATPYRKKNHSCRPTPGRASRPSRVCSSPASPAYPENPSPGA